MSDKKFSYIREDALLPIEISGKYYYELKKVFVSLMTDNESTDDMIKKLTKIASGKVSNPQEHMLHLMYVLINEIENVAVNKGMVEDRSVDSSLSSPES